jgi:hypothetical protein
MESGNHHKDAFRKNVSPHFGKDKNLFSQKNPNLI